MGSANELSPPINPVWRIILFPSSGQTLSVMKWPQVLPCNPVPSRPSNSACLKGKNGFQCDFNPTQPVLGFSGFVTSHLASHLTHSRYFFLSSVQVQLHFLWRSSTVPLLQIPLSIAVCTHSSSLTLTLSITVSLPLFSPYPPPVQQKEMELKQSLPVWWSESGQTPAEKLLLL